MPQYLYSKEYFQKHFQCLFNTNILSFSNDDLLFSEEQNNILNNLHKRVMPFILRRDKKQVLKELPEKIIQDYYCYKTDIQNDLYKFLQENEIKLCSESVETIIENLNQSPSTSQQPGASKTNRQESTTF